MGGSRLRRGLLWAGALGAKTAPLAATGAAIGGAIRASRGETPEERARRYGQAQKLVLGGGALALPSLAEEARASIHAVNLGRRVGRGKEYAKVLLPAFGTYGAHAAMIPAGTLAALQLLKRRERKKAQVG